MGRGAGGDMKAVGIDIGTTTISGVVFDIPKKCVKEVRTVPNGSFIKTKREWERMQDASVIWERVEAMLSELLMLHPDIGTIGLTGQMHGIVYTDSAGKCVSPLYTWQDARGDLTEKEEDSLAVQVQKKWDIRVPAGYGLLTHLYHTRKGMVPEKSVSLCTIADYIGMQLTGRKRPLMHSSNAASIGFFDSQAGCFQEDILRQSGIDLSMLPEVTGEFSVLGDYHGIPVTVGIGDNQAAFIGSVGLRENTLLFNMGTGGQISVLSERYFEGRGIEARPIVKGKYLLVGSSLCGGRAYAILEQFLRSYAKEAGAEDAAQYETMERLARRGMQRRTGMKVCTTFQGTRTDPAKRGSILNITEDNFTPESLVYGILEGMAGELHEMYEQIRQGTGIRINHIVGSGNGLRRNAVLQDIVCEMFGAEMELAPCAEEAAYGAALVGITAWESQKRKERQKDG